MHTINQVRRTWKRLLPVVWPVVDVVPNAPVAAVTDYLRSPTAVTPRAPLLLSSGSARHSRAGRGDGAKAMGVNFTCDKDKVIEYRDFVD